MKSNDKCCEVVEIKDSSGLIWWLQKYSPWVRSPFEQKGCRSSQAGRVQLGVCRLRVDLGQFSKSWSFFWGVPYMTRGRRRRRIPKRDHIVKKSPSGPTPQAIWLLDPEMNDPTPPLGRKFARLKTSHVVSRLNMHITVVRL